MKAIKINRKNKNYFLKAARLASVDMEELKSIYDKDYIYFFVVTFSQDTLFKLGIMYNNLLNEAKITTID